MCAVVNYSSLSTNDTSETGRTEERKAMSEYELPNSKESRDNVSASRKSCVLDCGTITSDISEFHVAD